MVGESKIQKLMQAQGRKYSMSVGAMTTRELADSIRFPNDLAVQQVWLLRGFVFLFQNQSK